MIREEAKKVRVLCIEWFLGASKDAGNFARVLRAYENLGGLTWEFAATVGVPLTLAQEWASGETLPAEWIQGLAVAFVLQETSKAVSPV